MREATPLPPRPRLLQEATDDQLMTELIGGDADAALGEIQERYRAAIFQFVVNLLRDEHLAQDVTQETFEKVFAKCDLYQPRGQFRAWLFEIARNQALTAIRARRRAPRPFSNLRRRDDDALPFEQLLGGEETRELEERELMQAFHQAVAALPERYQQVFRMCAQQGMQYQDAARELDLPTGTVAIRIMRARQRLWGELHKHFDRLRRPPACLQTAV